MKGKKEAYILLFPLPRVVNNYSCQLRTSKEDLTVPTNSTSLLRTCEETFNVASLPRLTSFCLPNPS